MSLHPWMAKAFALDTPLLRPSTALTSSKAAAALAGMAASRRPLNANAFPFSVSQTALDSYSDDGAPFWDHHTHPRWKDAPWVLFAYTDSSVFLARADGTATHLVCPFVWRLRQVDAAPFGFPDQARLRVRKNRQHPRARLTVEWPASPTYRADALTLLGTHGLYTEACRRLHAALMACAQTLVARVCATQPMLSNSTRGLAGGRAMCTPFQPLTLGNDQDVAVRTQDLVERAWALGARRLTASTAILDRHRTPVFPVLHAWDGDGARLPDVERRLHDHLRHPYQGIPATALVRSGMDRDFTITAHGVLHDGPVPDPHLSAHRFLHLVQDTPL